MLDGKDLKPEIAQTLSTVLVEDMADVGMGSIRFLRSLTARFGEAVANAEYTDEDGVLVSININVDEDGDLFEVDFWKVDSSPTKRYPGPFQIILVPIGKTA